MSYSVCLFGARFGAFFCVKRGWRLWSKRVLRVIGVLRSEGLDFRGFGGRCKGYPEFLAWGRGHRDGEQPTVMRTVATAIIAVGSFFPSQHARNPCSLVEHTAHQNA
ncbi:unnamed protein product, partial [Ectocarpus sp. 12 AP-2014]